MLVSSLVRSLVGSLVGPHKHYINNINVILILVLVLILILIILLKKPYQEYNIYICTSIHIRTNIMPKIKNKTQRCKERKQMKIVIRDFATPPFYGVSHRRIDPHRRLTARCYHRSEHSPLHHRDLVHLR